MSDQPETLGAILAEARNKYTVHDCNECDYRKSCDLRFDCDECKTKRKSISLALGIEDDYFMKLLDRIEAAVAREREKAKDLSKELDGNRAITGNAAAMRESIETMRRYAMLPQEELSLSLLQRTIHEKCDVALAAPYRNCDRFATELDARLAWKRETKCKGDYRYWLFSTVEGGTHA